MLTAKWNSFRHPSAIIANASCRSEQFESSFACVRCHRAAGQRFIRKYNIAVCRRSGETARLGCNWKTMGKLKLNNKSGTKFSELKPRPNRKSDSSLFIELLEKRRTSFSCVQSERTKQNDNDFQVLYWWEDKRCAVCAEQSNAPSAINFT